MKALVYTQPNRMEIQERPYPQLVAGEVIVKIEAAGVCGSDMHAYHGRDPRRKPGLVMGHELAGTVVESADARIDAGARVTANPLITCGRCDHCLQGRSNLCTDRSMVGMTRPGAFAEFMSIPSSSLVEIPQGLAPAKAAVTEPAATALHAINLSMRALFRPVPECKTLVIGGGAIGMLSALLLRSYGCGDITLAETNALRRESARLNLACKVCDPTVDAPADSAFDYVIDAVGAAPTRNMAIASAKPGSVVMHIGLQSNSSEIDMRKLTLGELTLLGCYTYSTIDMRAAIRAMHHGAFGTLDWIETRGLSQGAQAFDDLDKGRAASAKLILQPGG